MHFFHFTAHQCGQRHLYDRRQDGSQGGQVDRMLGLARLHAHEREDIVDRDDQVIGQVQVELVNDEEQEDGEKIEQLFHESVIDIQDAES